MASMRAVEPQAPSDRRDGAEEAASEGSVGSPCVMARARCLACRAGARRDGPCIRLHEWTAGCHGRRQGRLHSDCVVCMVQDIVMVFTVSNVP